MDHSEITVKKIGSFLQGYSRYYFDNIFSLPGYIKEQVYHRLITCKDTCLVSGECEICKCPTIKKAYANTSCNSSKFPDLMSKQEWEIYAKQNNITTGNDSIEQDLKELIKEAQSKDV